MISSFDSRAVLKEFVEEAPLRRRLSALLQEKTTESNLPLDLWEHVITDYLHDFDEAKSLDLQVVMSESLGYNGTKVHVYLTERVYVFPFFVLYWTMKSRAFPRGPFAHLTLSTENGTWITVITLPMENCHRLQQLPVWKKQDSLENNCSHVLPQDETCDMYTLMEFLHYYLGKVSYFVRQVQDYSFSSI
jgi:hypothetical protein